jgi:hypothetical protein
MKGQPWWTTAAGDDDRMMVLVLVWFCFLFWRLSRSNDAGPERQSHREHGACGWLLLLGQLCGGEVEVVDVGEKTAGEAQPKPFAKQLKMNAWRDLRA